MAKSVNKCFFVGNLGRDPELRHTKGGMATLQISLACSFDKKNSEGKYEPQTEWVPIVFWGRDAEYVAKYAAKGRQLHVEGRLQTRTYEKDGTKRYVTEVVANEVVLLGKADSQRQQGNAGSQSGGEASDNYIPDAAADDIPF